MLIQFDDMRILSDESYEKVPLVCSICNYMMRHSDIAEYRKYACCEYCSLFFAQPNSKKWKKGWRPSSKEINRVIKNREREHIYTMRGLKC